MYLFYLILSFYSNMIYFWKLLFEIIYGSNNWIEMNWERLDDQMLICFRKEELSDK